MSFIRAVVVDPAKEGRLTLQNVASPTAGPSEALVRVSAFSLNLGEVRRSLTADAGWRPGWDFAGTIEQQAADGSGPRTGSRVVGMLASGAWAELIAAPTHILAELPESVTFAQASTLPVAGLTALRSLAKGGLLIGHKVLVTGASGGVGHLACELASYAGAEVVAVVRSPERKAAVLQTGVQQVVVGDDLAGARQFGPYHLILDGVGGKVLGQALGMLLASGICVNFGASEAAEVTFDLHNFFRIGGPSLYGLFLFDELSHYPGAEDLGILSRLIARGHLHPQITVESSWTEVADIAQRLFKRQIAGKAVLHIS
jgi:NADPH:quinone reductase-like Zn-dependent oxidoreductase